MNEYLDENKKKRKKLAFTLIELLAVIVILAVILIIAVPKIMSIVKESKVGSMESSVKLVAKSIEEKYEASLANGEEGTLSLTGSCMNIGNLDTDEYEVCAYVIENGKVSVTLKGKDTGKFANLICIDSTKTNAECTTSQSYTITFNSNGANINDTTKVVAYGETYGELPTLTRKMYTFDGWYTEETSGNKVVNTTEMLKTNNHTLYAHWTYTGKTITLDDEIYQGYEYDDGTYIYRYMQEYDGINSKWTNISNDGWGVVLKDKTLTEVNVDPLSKINGKYIVSTRSMFEESTKLTKIKLDNFDTSSVVNMMRTFWRCLKIKTIDVSNFNTSNVLNMRGMFGSFIDGMALEEIIGLENFDTSNVTNMRVMFQDCDNLKSLDLSSFDTSNVTDMSYMFHRCQSIKTLDVTNFDTSNVTEMIDMFSDCKSLKILDLSSFDTSNVTDVSYMFDSANSLTSIIARTEADKAKFDASSYKPSTAIVTVKES